jgi:dihydrofolate reductase
MAKRKVILYIAMSIDGYIAAQDGAVDFLNTVDEAGEDYGYSNFIKTVDTVIMGRKTYDKVMSLGIGWPHKDKKCFILSRSKTNRTEYVTFYSNPVKDLIKSLRKEQGLNIYCDGGAGVVYELLKENLIDTFIISVIPCFLGKGIKLFREGSPPKTLKLVKIIPFKSGLIQMHYNSFK